MAAHPCNSTRTKRVLCRKESGDMGVEAAINQYNLGDAEVWLSPYGFSPSPLYPEASFAEGNLEVEATVRSPHLGDKVRAGRGG